ncbi:hypothetical protein H2248_008973 [Termitomyces sp. 'cryptogamus']|nr:hypothetical protein H2248_008973 [Termitomyces sp. 'cryptogamus']
MRFLCSSPGTRAQHISHFTKNDLPVFHAAFVRALRALATSVVLSMPSVPLRGSRPHIHRCRTDAQESLLQSEKHIELVYVEFAEGVLCDRVVDVFKLFNDDIVLQVSSISLTRYLTQWQGARLLANFANDIEAPHDARIFSHLPVLHDVTIVSTITASSPSISTSASLPHMPHMHTHTHGMSVYTVPRSDVLSALYISAEGPL